MRIRFLKQHRHWTPGDVADLPSGLALTLIDVGKAEPETATKMHKGAPRNKAVQAAEVKHGTR